MRILLKLVAALLLAIPLGVAAQTAYTTRDVNVRAGPDSSYPLVARLQGGTAVSVGGCIESYTWCDVYVGNLRGFVYATYLAYPYQSNEVPIYSYGPALGLPLITFSIGNYWDDYYRGRPFYNRRSYWASRPYHPPPPRFGHDWRPPPYHGGGGHHGRGHDNRPPPHHSDKRPPRGSHNQHDNGHRPPSHTNRPPPDRGSHSGNRGRDPTRNNADGGEAGG